MSDASDKDNMVLFMEFIDWLLLFAVFPLFRKRGGVMVALANLNTLVPLRIIFPVWLGPMTLHHKSTRFHKTSS